jgi:hypothetical protein
VRLLRQLRCHAVTVTSHPSWAMASFHHEKVRRRQSMSPDEITQYNEAHVTAALEWFRNPQGTVAQALELLDTVPPLVLGALVLTLF